MIIMRQEGELIYGHIHRADLITVVQQCWCSKIKFTASLLTNNQRPVQRWRLGCTPQFSLRLCEQCFRAMKYPLSGGVFHCLELAMVGYNLLTWLA